MTISCGACFLLDMCKPATCHCPCHAGRPRKAQPQRVAPERHANPQQPKGTDMTKHPTYDADGRWTRTDRPEMLSDRLGYPPERGDEDWAARLRATKTLIEPKGTDMSKYDNDDRAIFKQADHCEVTKDGDIWDVVQMPHGGWIAAPPTPGRFGSADKAGVYDEWIASLPVYGSADQAIASVIGEPA